MPTQKLDSFYAADLAEPTAVAVFAAAGQMTLDEVIASLRCVDCDAPITGDRADCAALRCHDCD
jgi:hypothetical protein